MKKINNFLLLTILLALFVACNKKSTEISDLDKLRNSTNAKSYPAVQMDSMQAINSITKQKVQELLDLSTLYLSGNRNTEIDTVIYSQMESYFHKPDSLTFKRLFKELDSMKVRSVKVNNLNVYKEFYKKDTLDYAKFNVEYFDDKNKSLGNFEKNAQYILISRPKLKKEFKFYFLDFYSKPLKKDSTSAGVTK
ncbi:hypothetical protein H3Z85_09615 [Chryseobacterium indologenes]|uniref:DUF4296 domain-containing protein n=1 Tax=Chryseobacterium indologenes TaxID=253 RepID=A0AAD0YXK1_CHRID|nr:MULTISPECIES: hypothetical protein [Chryseobacterium]ASE63645.1 hypothetical protein CEQ15_20235 [Chryseobacterium indologenes]ATN07654.1 hypothetical protein CRN76_20765 [Chryseobacterium indologenes]AYY83607.1 hypothetical protein EGX91_03065 [Chryseobacterium indologenes]AYZ37430.1 hypothetical protein EGY07_18745 [Chryseobacterium indologenes]AZB19358.1 hypothetical protein EG352_17025 [Chryseobacterium indologenes]